MARSGSELRQAPTTRLLMSRGLGPYWGNLYPPARLNRSRGAPAVEGALHHLPSSQNSSDTVTPR